MYNPISTYRLQFNKDFRLRDAEKLIEYFNKLGISTIYASPIFEAVLGSMHGYDTVNPQKINPEVGTMKELESLSSKLKDRNIGWLQDIVPNHMAYHSFNPWLFDLLEKGRHSAYADFFDIRWKSGKPFMYPFLGDDLQNVIEQGAIKLIFNKGRFYISVYDQNLPLAPKSYARVLQMAERRLPSELLDLIDDVSFETEGAVDATAWGDFILRFKKLAEESKVSEIINLALKKSNQSPERLTELAKEQEYKLCHWQETHHEINYRRFFTVNNLICLNIQHKKVFHEFHKTIFELTRNKIFQGLRIDHIDGLYAPGDYLKNLRDKVGYDVMILVEKILEYNEELPEDWPVQGSTGYGFLAQVNNLLTNNAGKQYFTDLYSGIARDNSSIEDQIRARKSLILYERMSGELDNLHQDLMEAMQLASVQLSEYQAELIKKTIGAFLIECPVYRFYGKTLPFSFDEAERIDDLLTQVRQNNPQLKEATEILRNAFLTAPGSVSKEYDAEISHFYQRLMQITGPLMAKGVEDTLMYSYNRFIGHNEVGDSLEVFGISAMDWHKKMTSRQKLYSRALNATSTHDTKRGEDVRARLNVLTDIPEIWIKKYHDFQDINKGNIKNGAPDKNDEYFVYLTLLGMYPMPGDSDNEVEERLRLYFQKALREAKSHSNWTNPNVDYENTLANFAISLLDKDTPFWNAFYPFYRKIVDFGIVNSLVQVTLKSTSPGTPDFYQGTELWDLSLVDPDNRRPVDYEKRIQWLDELENQSKEQPRKIWDKLWDERYNGKIKLWLTNKLLQYRRDNEDLFLHGEYIPLSSSGKFQNHILGFMRKEGDRKLLVVVPLNLAKLCNGNNSMINKINWEDTEALLPDNTETEWINILDKSTIHCTNRLSLKSLCNPLPILLLEKKN